MQRPLRVLLAVFTTTGLAAIVGGCESPSGPESSPVMFALRDIGGQPLPAVISNTAGGRLIEVVGGGLTFESFVGRGNVMSWSEVRITDPGTGARVERHETLGTSIRRGNALEVRYASGARETFAVEGDGMTLRTVAATCAPAAKGTACLDILRIYHYERIATPAEP